MYEILLIGIALASVIGCGWMYWRIQQLEIRLQEQESSMREKTVLVGELVDEMVAASQYLYEEMDRCLSRLEENRPLQPAALASDEHLPSPVNVEQPSGEPTVAKAADEGAPSPVGDPLSSQGMPPLSPYLQAQKLAAEGMDLVEIARHTDIGLEELRLVLRFQGELAAGG